MTDEQKATESAEDSVAKQKRSYRKKRKSAKAPPWVADSAALALVQKAAVAVDLSVEELANLIVESGIQALPPSDGITDTYTLKDLGHRLWSTMQQYPKDERAQWFEALAPTQQTAVIVTLRDKGFASQAISADFRIPIVEVNRTWNKHADDLGAQVVGIRLNTIAGNLQIVAERAQHMASESGDHAALWRIQKEFTACLQSLGITDRAIHKVEVTHKFDDQKRAALDQLVALERKKERRSEEIKLIEANVVDEVPEFDEETYD
ncbi:MAG: hypothetical protein V3R87_02835 [Dehalococcoidia bacterium]